MQTIRSNPARTTDGRDGVVVSLTDSDRQLVLGALRLVRGAIGREEFQTRLGVHLEEADDLLNIVSRAESGRAGAIPRDRTLDDDPTIAADETAMALSERQLRLINNALNEGLYGLDAEEVPTDLQGVAARSLLRAVGAILDDVSGGPPAGTPSGSRYFDHLR